MSEITVSDEAPTLNTNPDISATENSYTNLEKESLNYESSDEDDIEKPTKITKKRVQRFSGSDSASGTEETQTISNKDEVMISSKEKMQTDSDSDDTSIFKTHPLKSRTRISNEVSDSDSARVQKDSKKDNSDGREETFSSKNNPQSDGDSDDTSIFRSHSHKSRIRISNKDSDSDSASVQKDFKKDNSDAREDTFSRKNNPKSDSDSDDTSIFRSHSHKSRIRISNKDSDSESSSGKKDLKGNDSVTMKDGKENSNSDSDSDDTSIFKIHPRKSRIRISHEDSDSESLSGIKDLKGNDSGTMKDVSHGKENSNSDSDSGDTSIFKSHPRKSRIRISNEDSDSEASSAKVSLKNEEQQARMKNKKNKLKEKFRKLITSRNDVNNKNDGSGSNNDGKSGESGNSDDKSSVEKIKQIIRERTMGAKMSICDPDTSDEETKTPKSIQKPKKGRKSTKPTSPKPMRMTAKQAMENMQKIKSESNRMLREKEVSLPYHRPKALSLKDIMSRRRPAVSADGKVLPIKMNEEQLKQYAQALEERQREMMELCKSESEEEETETKNQPSSTLNTDIHNSNDEIVAENSQSQDETSCQNDTLIDTTSNINTEVEVNAATDLVSEEITSLSELPEKHLNDNVAANNNDPIEVNKSGDIETTKEIANDFDDGEENNSAEMSLIYNDSVEEEQIDTNTEKEPPETRGDLNENSAIPEDHVNKAPIIENSESKNDSQMISLHYDDTEKQNTEDLENDMQTSNNDKNMDETEFSDDDVNMEDIDKLIENAEIIHSQSNQDNVDSPMLIKDSDPLKIKPKLNGRPGMVIDLDGTDACTPKLTGVELLKQRFTFFAKLKTPEELEREREKKIKPGTQHIKLKQQLEDEIAEQRSLEWAKRLEEEKQQQMELNAVRGDDDEEDDLDKIEAELEEKEECNGEEPSGGESEPEEEPELEEEKPRKRNPMVDDEAEVSDDDLADADDEEGDDEDEEDSKTSSEEESEDEQQSKLKKGRILKAFEDSDEEDGAKIQATDKQNGGTNEDNTKIDKDTTVNKETEIVENKEGEVTEKSSPNIKDTQDDEIQLAQIHKSFSGDLFTTSQESDLLATQRTGNPPLTDSSVSDDKDLGTQTFSILESSRAVVDLDIPDPEKLTVTSETQPLGEDLDAVVDMCSGSFSQNLVTSQYQTQTQANIGEDVLALCTGQFYDNQFVSQVDISSQDNNEVASKTGCKSPDKSEDKCIEIGELNKLVDDYKVDMNDSKDNRDTNVSLKAVTDNNNATSAVEVNATENVQENVPSKENKLLSSILDELNDPEFDSPKPNRFFANSDQGKENTQNVANIQLKKRFIIDSDDEGSNENVGKKKKKLKKKKMEQRALQISDDEEEEDQEDDNEDDESEIEEDVERVVEYDSEENEVVVLPEQPKKKRKIADFFEQEAELTSEDEWAGSGDEDERGLDRMEREEGDDETFNQNALQRELGQIHMRDVLDQDKREVRMIQELLFEDGDLGAGGRQRKFRWRNADGEEEVGTTTDELVDTQEEEFESEEQWRKQRHERAMFLKQMQQEEEEKLNVSVNRTTIVKANLNSRTMSSLLLEMNESKTVVDSPAPVPEKKSNKDIPSPKKPFAIFQQSYHGSLLTRGRGALARLAALATPLAVDDDAPKIGSLAPSSKRNFVFAAITPEEDEPKVTKRKAESNIGTPRLVKKMRTEEKQKRPSNSLLDHIKI